MTAIVIIVIAVIIGAAHRAVGQAASDVGHVMIVMAEVITGIAASALTGALAYAGYRTVKAVRSAAWYQARADARRAVRASSEPRVLYVVQSRPAIDPARASLDAGSWHAEHQPGTVDR